MINLAGEKNADKHILEELHLAGIKAVKADEETKGEVPYTFVGKIGKWTLERRWYYWSASVNDREKGLPLDAAMKLHNMKHPTDETVIIGDTVRAGGHGGGISPDGYVSQPIYNAEFISECKALGIEVHSQKSMGIGDDETEYPKLNYGEIAKLCNEGKIKAERYVNCYHIDTQEGLNEFVRVIKSLNK